MSPERLARSSAGKRSESSSRPTWPRSAKTFALTQAETGAAKKVAGDEISRIERSGDDTLLSSTLQRIVAATSGTLDIALG